MFSNLVLIYFGSLRLRHTIKANFITFHTNHPEIISNLIFFKNGLALVSLPYFVSYTMILQEEYFSRYVLLTDQISLSGYLYFLRYWVICRGGARDLEKGALYVGHHGWPAEKVLGFRWSKKAKITYETISFWQNISISIFKFAPFLHAIKAWWWNLFNF